MAPPAGTWRDVTTDGLGDIAASYWANGAYDYNLTMRVVPSDGGAAQDFFEDRAPIPRSSSFIWQSTGQGPCLVCSTSLRSWPDGGMLFVGDGYPWHGYCSYAMRPRGGLYAMCARAPFMDEGALPTTLQQFDDALSRISSVPVDGDRIVAVDRLDRIVESSVRGQRWIDADGAVLSGGIGIDAIGSMALLGGGLLTTSDSVIPSGSDQPQPAPEWLQGGAALGHVVLGERAYALSSASCVVRVHDAAGELCGTLKFARCSQPPSFGPDGSAIVAVRGGGWAIWPRLLR